jgi:hypothetical protein
VEERPGVKLLVFVNSCLLQPDSYDERKSASGTGTTGLRSRSSDRVKIA